MNGRDKKDKYASENQIIEELWEEHNRRFFNLDDADIDYRDDSTVWLHFPGDIHIEVVESDLEELLQNLIAQRETDL